ncbi:HAD family hydrolase [Bacillus chungangensis]|uniref:Hydrolase of the HAD superfamily n=1 Tax=Bacillus chungangensis TaxID=587633 RepID=A0ABT9WNY7_9BACI|nr:HAD family hydrolase [Bacillus chungangensis]MDQ0174996.1 putative hydrolase of the HAD superfamily [Bacillus chungangensis]
MYTIVFDLDDTLYDRTQPLKKTLSEFDATKHLSFNQFYPIYQRNSDIGFDHVANNVWTLEESHIFRIQDTLLQLGISIDKLEALSFQNLYKSNQEHIELYPFITEILNDLKDNGIQTLIMTNGPSIHQRNKIKNLGLDHYFNDYEIIVSEEERMAKPDCKIFELAERKFKFDKNNAWFIGDSYPIDIVGAHNAGWRTIWLNCNHQLPSSSVNLATKTVYSTKELKNYLFHILNSL